MSDDTAAAAPPGVTIGEKSWHCTSCGEHSPEVDRLRAALAAMTTLAERRGGEQIERARPLIAQAISWKEMPSWRYAHYYGDDVRTAIDLLHEANVVLSEPPDGEPDP